MIGHHNVVLVHMPGIGKVSATSAAAYSRFTFKEIRLALVVGICGGIPFGKGGEETFLGDVVISNCIVQYDLGRQYSDQLIRKDTLSDSLGRPNSGIRAILAKLQTMQGKKDLLEATADNLSTLSKALSPVPLYPGRDQDKLFDSKYRHKHQSPSLCETCTVCIERNDPVCGLALESTCEDLGCDEVNLIPRQPSKKHEVQRSTQNRPAIHFGPIGSADSVMKSGELRDILSTREGFIALEMEAAGVWDILPCLVIKGICDYADSHKSKEWQNYAAAAAAACTKAFLAALDRAY
ncbi:unnamed protein product [Penicillium salamii]|nr:unnamed protein product [Penicillium salamii]